MLKASDFDHPEVQRDPLTEKVIGAALEVHKTLGPGLLESTYSECLARELSLRSIAFRREVPLNVSYKGVSLDCGYRLDFLVEERLLIEMKSVEQMDKLHEAQLLTYLKLAKVKTGLLLNFNVALLRDGIIRRVL